MNASARILNVDDEPNVRLVFRAALESAGYAIATAEDGQAALGELVQHGADLVLLDLQVPVMDGMKTLRRLREAGSTVPAIMITAHGSVPHAVEAMKLGAVDFLAKPISPDALRSAVATVLDRHAAPASILPNEPVTIETQFAADLARAKRALNRREFAEAEVFLVQSIALKQGSAEAHNLMGVLHELRNEHDASYREYKAALKADKRYAPAMHNMTRYYERFTFGRSGVPLDTGEN